MKSNFMWLIFILYASITFIFPYSSLPIVIFGGIVVFLGCIFALVHGISRYGAKGMFFFVITCLVISNILENLSIATGFPFGHYHYSDSLGIKLFAVPLLIGPAYFSTGYLAFTIGNILLGRIDTRLNKLNVFLLPFTASFVMVMWDIAMDPISSTINKSWIWENGGGFFGVPLSNFLGWFLTVYLFFQLFTIYLYRNAKTVQGNFPKVFWLQPILFYLVIALSSFVNYLASKPGTVIDAAGVSWNQQSILETSVIVSLFTMCFAATLAAIRIFSKEN